MEKLLFRDVGIKANEAYLRKISMHIDAHICDRLWEKGHIRAYFQNRVIGTAG